METEKNMDMFEGINTDGIYYLLGFLSALIQVARKNEKETVEVRHIEIAIELAKKHSKEYNERLPYN